MAKQTGKVVAKRTPSIDSTRLAAFLGKVYLGGLLEECVVHCGADKLFVRAVDLTNSIFIYCEEHGVQLPLPPKVDKVGVGNLGMLYKLLDMAKGEPITLSYNGNRLDIDRGEHGVFHYLLSDPSVIPTVVEQPDAMQKLEALCTCRTSVARELQKDFLAYMAVSDSKIVTFQVEGGELMLVGGTATDHQFRIAAGSVKAFKGKAALTEGFSLAVYGVHLKAVLQALDFPAEGQGDGGAGKITFDKEQAEFWYADGKPLLIREGSGNVWALVPVEVTKGE